MIRCGFTVYGSVFAFKSQSSSAVRGVYSRSLDSSLSRRRAKNSARRRGELLKRLWEHTVAWTANGTPRNNNWMELLKGSYEISKTYNVLFSDVRLNDTDWCCIMLHFGTAQINTNDINWWISIRITCESWGTINKPWEMRMHIDDIVCSTQSICKYENIVLLKFGRSWV